MPSTDVVRHHVPRPASMDDREPPTRRPILFADRTKVLLLIAAILFFVVVKKHGDMQGWSWGEALRDQIRAKWWLIGLAGLEVVRQTHYFISERSAGWHQGWQTHVWRAWENRVGKMNPWLRYRSGRFFKLAVALFIVALYFSFKWKVSPFEAIAQLPSRTWTNFFTPVASLPFIFELFFIVGLAVIQFAAIFWFMAKGGVDTYMPGEIKTRFTDVWGQDNVLKRVKENVLFLERPEEIESRGGHVPGGILLWGPPGTGKTLMAEAIAGETDRPYVFVEPGAFRAMFFGVDILKVKGLYRRLRRLALRHGGVIVFFDEADSLGNRGLNAGGVNSYAPSAMEMMCACNGSNYVSEHTQSALWNHARGLSNAAGNTSDPQRGRGLRGFIMNAGGGYAAGALQALLAEMSGLKKPRGFFSRRVRAFLGIRPKTPPPYRILHIMATNQPGVLDDALLRPGRIDRQYHVGYPHLEGRIKTFQGYFDKIQHELTTDQIERLALMSPYFSGAKVKDIVNESVIIALREGRDVVTFHDVIKARHEKSHGEADDWTYGALERHAVAIHEASHAVAMYRLQKRAVIDVATIERRGTTGGFVAPVPIEERFSEWRSEMENDVMTFLASLAGERLFFADDNSAGVGGDLMSSTRIVMEMEAYWAMGSSLGSHRVNLASHTASTNRPEDGTDRQMLNTEFGKRIEAKLGELFERTQALIAENRHYVLAVAHALETKLTITGEDIAAIFNGQPGPYIDGRLYLRPEMMEAIEAYHAAAVVAHRSQGKLEHPLPKPEDVFGFGGAPASMGPLPVGAPLLARSPSVWAPPPPPPPSGLGGPGGNGIGTSGEPEGPHGELH